MSRLCSESNCGVLSYNGSSHEVYPQPRSRPTAPVQCHVENCKWIGEANSCEEHHLKEHPSYIVEPSSYNDATHVVESKRDYEESQDELKRLKHDVEQSKILELDREKEWKEVKSERERREHILMQKIGSQNSKHVDAVIKRSVMPNQQLEANSTASLGRAEQLPQQERSRTLDAQGSDFQVFCDMLEHENVENKENYAQPRTQTEEQGQSKESLVVGCLSASDSPPPLPPKPKQTTQERSPTPAAVVPPMLPPKPNSNQGTLPFNLGSLTTSTTNVIQQNDTTPPPRPPKPSQAKAALPQLHRRRKTPLSLQNHETDAERRESGPCGVKYESSAYLASCGVQDAHSTAKDQGNCPNCVRLRERNEKLRESNHELTKRNDRLKRVVQDKFFNKSPNAKASIMRSRLPTN